LGEIPADATMTYRRHPEAEARRRSAVALIKLLLSGSQELLPAHRHEFLKLALWKITEAETAKYQTRFRSEASLSSSMLQHDHVFQRALMVEALLAAPAEKVDEILSAAIGCTITREEHRRLNHFKHLDGWERYSESGIVVIDMETGKPADLSQLSRRPHRGYQ
jgi:hypothetical protein